MAEQNDPYKYYCKLGYLSILEGRKRRHSVPQNFKLSYSSGRLDALQNKPSRYDEK